MTETAKQQTPPRILVLTGFMGSGKTTVGQRLARHLGWHFLDVDEVIEADSATTIAEIFHRDGEAAFRKLERETIARLVAGENLVLALGGGAIESPESRALLLGTEGVLLIHLEVSLATTLKRCQGTEGRRPVLADRANLEVRYQKRLPLYRESHHSIPVDQLTPRQVTDAVLEAAGLAK